MRMTLTIDDDISEKLKAKLKNSTDKTFKDVVNETLRRGLLAEKDLKKIIVLVFAVVRSELSKV